MKEDSVFDGSKMMELALPQRHHHPAAAPPQSRHCNCFCTLYDARLLQFSPKTSYSNPATTLKLHATASRQRNRMSEGFQVKLAAEEDENEAASDVYNKCRATSKIIYGGEEEEEDQKDDSGILLSLTQKPDRNSQSLDDYELEELDYSSGNPNHRSGYVAVLGKPNVGKSTLSNQMVGQKLSIVTDKPQTTRHRILGICSGPEYQMILYDTPGVIEKKMHKLDSMMMRNVRNASVSADCILIVVDACKAPEKIDEVLHEGVGGLQDRLPILLVLNKKDLIKPGEIGKKLEWYEKFTCADEVIPVSAKYGHGVEDVKDWILSKLPPGPSYYPRGIASEHPERFFVAEIVREKIFMQYRNEVPYACQVNAVSYKSRPQAKDFIQVEVIVEKNSQKGILVGKEGKALKLLATAARLDIEDFLQKKVFLEIEVKVKENWRQNEGLLKHYGYGGQIQAL
ncbi:unnamed protein product [Cuscuta epithymum]|uniref:Era-type G domain-containing protein n=1 Tax=Cuscuta epithymum TaxID=186058 RepID=A0AAV0D2A4_9ASTE|nr:unnamed protein product [Cuscuta epithymum]